MNESDPLDLVLVQTFVEVARLGSVTAAARELGRSQPAISHRLRCLERELGVPLFEKIGRRLQLTDFGRELQLRCLDLIALSRGLRDLVSDTEGPIAGRVRVGTFPTIAAHLLVPAVGDLLAHPELELAFTFDLIEPLLERVRIGLLDLALVFSDRAPEGFAVSKLGETQLVAIMPTATAPARASVAVSRLRRQRYLAWAGPSDPTSDRIGSFVTDNQLVTRFTPQIPHVETLRELVASGAGYTILPRYTAARSESRGRVATRVPRGLNEAMTLYLISRPRQVVTRAVAEVRGKLAELADSELLG